MNKKDVIKKLENEEITVEDLLNNQFMQKYTQFSSYEDLEEELATRAKSKNIDEQKLIRNILLEKTSFKSLEEMKATAIEFFVKM